MLWGASGALLLSAVLFLSDFAQAKHSLRARNSTKVVDAYVSNATSIASDIPGTKVDGSEEMEDDGSVEVSWSPTVQLVQKSLEETEAERSSVQEKLRLLRKSCVVDTSACAQAVEETAAKLRRLTIAVAQLRQIHQNDAWKVEEDEKKKAVQEASVERDISDLVALQQFARLSKDDVDVQRKKYKELSDAYAGKIEDADKAIAKVHDKLEKARDKERNQEGSAVSFTSDAMAISDGVNATDAFVEEEVMEAQRKEHSAAALFKKAQGMAYRAASMLRYHKASLDTEEEEADTFPLTQSESDDLPPCPPHHSESGESFIQKSKKACIPIDLPAPQAKDDIIEEAEAAAKRARVAEDGSDDDSADQEDDFDAGDEAN
jgi:hypothetical protein